MFGPIQYKRSKFRFNLENEWMNGFNKIIRGSNVQTISTRRDANYDNS